MDQAPNPQDISGLDVVLPAPQDVGLNLFKRDPQDDDLNIAMTESKNDDQYMVMPHFYDDGLNIGMSQSQDDGLNMGMSQSQDDGLNMGMSQSQNDGLNMGMSFSQDDGLNMGMSQSQDDGLNMEMSQSHDDSLNMVNPLDNGLDPAVAKAMVATSECHSIMPLLKLELNTRIKLRRPNFTVSSRPKPPPEMTASEMDQREKVRTRNKHHANMSRIRKKERENLFKEEIGRYETENALLKDEIAISRGQIQILEDILHRHECLLRPLRDTPPT